MHLHYLHLGRRRQSAFWDGMEMEEMQRLAGRRGAARREPVAAAAPWVVAAFPLFPAPWSSRAACSVLSAVDFRVTSTSAASHYQQTADCRLQTAWDGDGGE